MKNIFVVLALCFFGTQAKALQFYEGFSYPPDSALEGQGGWVLSSGTSPVIRAGTLVTPGIMPAGEGNSLACGGGAMEVRHALTNVLGAEPPGTYFYSLTFKVISLGTMTTNGSFIVGFSQPAQTAAHGGLLYFRKDIAGAANSYNIGVAKTSGLGGTVVWGENVYLVGQTNFIVCKYTTPAEGDPTTQLWINPDPSTYGVADANRPAPDLVATEGADLLTGVGQILLKTSATESPGEIIIDQIRVEGGWPHVTPVPLTTSAEIINETDLYLSWGGNQNVILQQATNLTPPVAWTSLSSDGSIRNYTISAVRNEPSPRFYRLHAWHAE